VARAHQTEASARVCAVIIWASNSMDSADLNGCVIPGQQAEVALDGRGRGMLSDVLGQIL
jgi:hypothetical protein